MPIDWENRLQTLVVKFACRTSLVQPDSALIERVRVALRELSAEHFESPVPQQQLLPNTFMAMQRRHYVANGSVDVPSFGMQKDVVEISYFRKIGGNMVQGADQDLWMEEVHGLQPIRQVLLKLQEVIPNYRIFRTAQVFELLVAPLSPGEIQAVQQNLLANPNPEIGLFRLITAVYHSHGNRMYNYHREVTYSADNPNVPYPITVKIDVNNRLMSDSLDPHVWDSIWRHGQEMRSRLIDEVFGAREG